MTDPLIAFYRGEATDAAGRRIEEILAWSDGELEAVHDYIQWLFPLSEPSVFSSSAPIVTPAVARSFRDDPALRATLTRAFDRFLEFLGLESRRTPAGLEIVRGPRFAERSRTWLHPGNHNFLRITRVLKSLRLLGLEDLAEGFLLGLEEIYREHSAVIGTVTHAYWREAGSGGARPGARG